MTIITGEQNVRMAALLALRGALKLETKGMKKNGRSALAITNKTLGTSHRTAIKAYAALNAHIVSKLGSELDRPLQKASGKKAN
jgi:hypothetical protein